jgi:DNA-binding transcriptional MerR regulator
MYTVKQLSDLAGVSVRTLHYYDEIGLLRPPHVAANGYRYYDDQAVFKLQQILFFRELGFSLNQILDIIDQPAFDLLNALHAHRGALHDKIRRLQTLIQTVDSTILHLSGEMEMSKKKLFTGFTPEEEKRYAQEARERWGAENVDASYQRWNNYTPEKREAIKAEGGAIYTDLMNAMDQDPASPAVQAIVARWHQHIRNFYEPTVEIMRGLSQLYVDDPNFARNFREMHADLPEFMQRAIGHYCDALEQSQ